MGDYNETMTSTAQANAEISGFTSLVHGTTSYQTRLELLGDRNGGDLVSRALVLSTLQAIGWDADEVAYFDARMGVRAAYHADVVCSFLANALLSD